MKKFILPQAEPKPLKPDIYLIDPFNRNPIFSVKNKPSNDKNIYVRTWKEAFAICGKVSISEISPEYISHMITFKNSSQISPYKNIKRIQKGSLFINTEKGDHKIYSYKPFNFGANQISSEKLSFFLKNRLLQNIEESIEKNKGNICCEHSSGLDSNSILGAISFSKNIDNENLYTWSFEGQGEKNYIEEFRRFYKLNLNNCLKSPTIFSKETLINLYKDNIKILGYPQQIGGNTIGADIISKKNCKILFSGFGGDQGISHNGLNIANNLLFNFKLTKLVDFEDGLRNAFRNNLGRVYSKIFPYWLNQKMLAKEKYKFKNNPLLNFLTEEGLRLFEPYFKLEEEVENNPYLNIKDSIEKRLTAEWISVRVEEESLIAKNYGIKKYFPLLDELSIGTILNQNPEYFAENHNQGRLIHRKAFKDFLHPLLVENPSKFRTQEENWEMNLILSEKRIFNYQLEEVKDLHEYLYKLWDIEKLIDYFNEVLETTTKNNFKFFISKRALSVLIILNYWFKFLED